MINAIDNAIGSVFNIMINQQTSMTGNRTDAGQHTMHRAGASAEASKKMSLRSCKPS